MSSQIDNDYSKGINISLDVSNMNSQARIMIKQDVTPTNNVFVLSFSGYFQVSGVSSIANWPVSFYLMRQSYPYEIVSTVKRGSISSIASDVNLEATIVIDNSEIDMDVQNYTYLVLDFSEI